MVFRAMETPIDAPIPAEVTPMPMAAAADTTVATTEAVLSASRSTAAAVTVLESMNALTVVSTVFSAMAPAPLTATPAPMPSAAASAAAAVIALIVGRDTTRVPATAVITYTSVPETTNHAWPAARVDTMASVWSGKAAGSAPERVARIAASAVTSSAASLAVVAGSSTAAIARSSRAAAVMVVGRVAPPPPAEEALMVMSPLVTAALVMDATTSLRTSLVAMARPIVMAPATPPTAPAIAAAPARALIVESSLAVREMLPALTVTISATPSMVALTSVAIRLAA